MDQQFMKSVMETLQHQASATEQLVQVLGHLARVNEQHLAIAMGQVEQIDFTTLPDEVREKFLAQFGCQQPAPPEPGTEGQEPEEEGEEGESQEEEEETEE